MFNLDREKNGISLFFIESPDFFSLVSRFSFIRGWQVCKKEESVVKYSPINRFIKGFSPSMAVNSYLNDNVEGKQFYFSFGSFSTQRSLN